MRLVAALVVASLLAASTPARADDVVERYEVELAVPSGRRLLVENPLGPVVLKAWDRPEVRVLADKRGPTHDLVERLRVHGVLADGTVAITTRVVMPELGGAGEELGMPMEGMSVALEIDAPRGMPVVAETFNGDLHAGGFRAGARLTSNAGEVSASDIAGAVTTRVDSAAQRLEAIRGDVDSVGVDGDVDLDDVRAPRLVARVRSGRIRARRIRAGDVWLATVFGQVQFSGVIAPGGRYELTSYQGSVEADVDPGSAGFSLTAASPSPPEIHGIALRNLVERDGVVRASYGAGGARVEIVTHEGVMALGIGPLAAQ